MFGLKKVNNDTLLVTPKITARVLFGKEVIDHPIHGVLCAEHSQLKIGKHDGLPFAFEGIEAPHLTQEIMAYVTAQAMNRGFKVHYLHSYAMVTSMTPPPKLRPKDEQPQPLLKTPSATGTKFGHAIRPRKPSGERTNAAA